MKLDFALILVVLTAVTGVIWAIDHFLFAKARSARHGEAAKEPLLVEYSRSFFPVIFIVLIIRSFIAEPFRIPSSSMMPSLLIGDFILVNKFAYGIRIPVLNKEVIAVGKPKRGDVAVFKYPGKYPGDPSAGTDYIKRVIGVPGDTISYVEKLVYINGQPVEQVAVGPYEGVGQGQGMTGALRSIEKLPGREHEILQSPYASPPPPMGDTWTVPEGAYLVLGDNRDNSEDSRYWGMVPEANLVGRAFFIWMNWDFENGGVDFGRIGSVIRGGE
ncbi:MAG TPA: signal peptidase I [Patescibacteria group bacterium]|nr:signal peptidase I [Patescibacteria group bacterium]